ILFRVIAKGLKQGLVGRERTGRAHQQGVAVRRRPGCGGGPGVATRAGTVIDDKILTQGLRHLLQHDTRDHIARASAGERHDHLDRSGRVILDLCARNSHSNNGHRDHNLQECQYSRFGYGASSSLVFTNLAVSYYTAIVASSFSRSDLSFARPLTTIRPRSMTAN